jgi:iron complex transport system permease protein
MPTAAAFAALLLALAAAATLNLFCGAVPLSAGTVIGALTGNAEVDPSLVAIVRDLRLPRVILAGLVGAALGVAGVAYQALFRNPLADPYVVGASNGAALGAVLMIVLGGSLTAPGVGPASAGAFVGALGAVALVYLVGAAGRMPPVALLLAGAAVSTMFGGVVWLLLALADQDLSRIVAWLMGGLSGRGWPTLGSIAVPLLLGVGLLWASARILDALCVGEESARALGLRVGSASALLLAGASLATAAAVAVGGVIGFVGLVAPHCARRLVGGAHVRLLPAGGLVGAILLLVADGLARSAAPPLELPVGVVTAVLGGPFFLIVLRRQVNRSLGA